ncbi:MAG TPA: aminoglycoside phosphotransferase family protein [Actinomycetota bacterium]|nr:aminoglycoside phosphotransferase family protein [Actinomycetota bacterium]
MEKADITPELVSRLIAEQLPQWSDLPIAPVEHDGWDNTTFRLGTDKLVRLPSSRWYVEQVEKEQHWLPILAEQLPLPIPEPLAKGEPGAGFPRPWSVYRWHDGDLATIDRIPDLPGFASDLAGFLTKLFAIDPTGGPSPGQHNFFRGAPVGTYDAETRYAIEALAGEIDAGAAAAVWEAALAATWQGPPVWFHGDVSPSNLLVVDGRLAAVIDFGCSGVGDPACDLTIAWTFFHGPSREAFRAGVPVDDPTWARARGWALWKALITLRTALTEGSASADAAARRYGWRCGAREVIEELLAEHRSLARD